jgi:hypothetical protein
MSVTKEQVLDKAKELGLTPTEDEVNQYVKDNKLPEKQPENWQKQREALKGLSSEQLLEKCLDYAAEARDRRLEAKELRQQMGDVKKELDLSKDAAQRSPELEKKLKDMETQIQSGKDAEKKRREAKYSSLDEKKKNAFKVLLDVDRVGSDDFDAQMEIISGHKSDGHSTESPGGPPGPVALTDAQKKEASDMNLEPAAYLEVMGKRKKQ